MTRQLRIHFAKVIQQKPNLAIALIGENGKQEFAIVPSQRGLIQELASKIM